MAEAQVIDNDTGGTTEQRGIIPRPTADLFAVGDPVEVITKATAVAEALAGVIEKQGLYTTIRSRKGPDRKHVRVEGWTLLGSMLGVFPKTEWTRKVEGGWEARVVAVTRAGEEVGAGEMECLKSEANWSDRDDYAIRSMAQTRATSKALKGPLSFIMTLAGFDATPAEEVPPGGFGGKASGPDLGAVLAAAQAAWPDESQFPACEAHGPVGVALKRNGEPFLACPKRDCDFKKWPNQIPPVALAAMVAALTPRLEPGDPANITGADPTGDDGYVNEDEVPW